MNIQTSATKIPTYAPRIIIRRKFNFVDTSLAITVREKLYSIILTFDLDGQGKLNEDQIKIFLANVMKKSDIELKYSVKNVLRYDQDRDNLITLDELVNYCVEQQFGSTAIQYFHKQKEYSQGSKRIIYTNEFIKTVNYCLGLLNLTQKQQILESIFKAIDQNCVGFITYEDYFKYLKEFFGSESEASTMTNSNKINEAKIISNIKTQHISLKQIKTQINREILSHDLQKQFTVTLTPKSQDDQSSLAFSQLQTSNFYEFNDSIFENNELEARISKMIYTQFKLIIFRYDVSKNLQLEESQLKKILIQQFKMNKSEIDDFIEVYLNGEKVISYQLFMREVIPYYLCQLIPKWNSGNNHYLSGVKFADEMRKYLSFMKARPFHCDLNQLFQKYDRKNIGTLLKNDYKSMIRRMLKSYSFIGLYNSSEMTKTKCSL